jgi:GNAT superfamily N-acetyltransferase
VRIREAVRADLDALAAVKKAASEQGYAHIYPPEEHPYPDEAVRAEVVRRFELPQATYLVAEEEGRILGYAGISPGWVEQLYVVPGAQGRGVGSALLEAAVERRRAAGDTELRLWTLEENTVGRRFYEARGWELAPETRVVPYPPQPVDVSYVLRL